VIEVRNDQFPTGVFVRRIDRVKDPSGEECLALEEDMSLLRLEPIGTDRSTIVASIVDEDKFRALDRVLDATGFDSIVNAKCTTSGKSRDHFLVAIKPNFMFAYSRLLRPSLIPSLFIISSGVSGPKVTPTSRSWKRNPPTASSSITVAFTMWPDTLAMTAARVTRSWI
jgi:hypothetical protein